MASFSQYIGENTNNYAEYTALVHALRLLSAFNLGKTVDLLDSDLMVQQVKGVYRVKQPHLKSLHSQVMSLLGSFRNWRIDHVPREENREADKLANQALDDYEGSAQGAPAPTHAIPRKPQTSLFE